MLKHSLKISRTASVMKRLSMLWEECAAFYTFFRRTDKNSKNIIFYSSQAQYISFLEGLIDSLITNHNVKLCYITSDCDDPILYSKSPDITTFCFNKLFPFVLPFVDASAIVMTMPDINQFHVKRSINEKTNHVYVFHSLISTHMGYRRGAFDYYDTVFCAGPHHRKEVRRNEEVYGLKPKRLLAVGYSRVDKIFAEHKTYLSQFASIVDQRRTCVLIAPSWQPLGILETCGRELIATLLEAGHQVIFRPHPMTIVKEPGQLLDLEQEFIIHENFQLDTNSVSEKFIHQADVMICDWSGVAFEYAFGTERPVLFIDLPRKVRNLEYKKLGIEPMEESLREEIGKIIGVDEVANAGVIISDFISNRHLYRDKIVKARDKYVYNLGESSDIGANYIIDICNGRM